MNKLYLKPAAAAIPLFMLTGCIDNNYDLDNIDTTTEIKIKDLVIPINVDAIALRDIFTFDEESQIDTLTINGKTFYAITQSGTFSSDPITIDKVLADAPALTSTERQLSRVSRPASVRAKDNSADEAYAEDYEIVNMTNSFSYSTRNLDEAILSIQKAKTNPITFSINLTTSQQGAYIKTMRFTDLRIQLPAGLGNSKESAGTYDATTGIWTIPSLEMPGTGGSISLTADEIDLSNSTISADHTFSYDSSFEVLGGILTLVPDLTVNNNTVLPSTVNFKASYGLTDMTINAVQATIDYRLGGMNIDPVELGDLPDFLDNPATNIVLTNPQIYLNLNNPVATDGLIANIDLNLTAERSNGVRDLNFPLGQPFVLGDNYGNDGPYNYVLAPQACELTTPAGYTEHLQQVNFNSLGSILSVPEEDRVTIDGEEAAGLPDRISISLPDPQVVNNPAIAIANRPYFELGNRTPAIQVNGKYELIAPLSLAEGSLIIYSEKQDGWDNDDLSDLRIETLSISCHGESKLPVSAELTVYPLDKEGHRIPCRTKSMTIPAGGTAEMEIAIEAPEGEPITGIDGVEYVATLSAGADEDALQTGQTINLTNIRAKVSGSYVTDF